MKFSMILGMVDNGDMLVGGWWLVLLSAMACKRFEYDSIIFNDKISNNY